MSDKKPAIPTYTFRGQESKAPSVAVADSVGNALLKEPTMYSGTNMLGIGQLHKSNAIPIFRSDDIVDLSHMRR